MFTIPEGYYPKLGARVMSLQDPKRKMSKSDPDDCFISMLDGPDVVRRKLRRAVTDSESEIRFDAENKPGVSNLLAMLCALTGESMDHAVESFAGKGYGDLKSAVADAIVATLQPLHERQGVSGNGLSSGRGARGAHGRAHTLQGDEKNRLYREVKRLSPQLRSAQP